MQHYPDTALTDGLLATITLDTTGFTVVGEWWDLKLTDAYAGSSTDIRDWTTAKLPLDITNGTITILPEPATLGVLALGALGAVWRGGRRPAR